MLEQLHDFHEVTIGQVMVSEILLTITMNCFFFVSCFLDAFLITASRKAKRTKGTKPTVKADTENVQRGVLRRTIERTASGTGRQDEV